MNVDESTGGRLRALAELARLSNAPTIVTNSMAGMALGAASIGADLPWARLPIVAGALVALYVAGMFLNDVFDLRIDRQERPERPLPSGRFPVGGALFIGIMLLLVGVAVVALIHPVAGAAAGALAVTIVAYDLLHAKWAGSVVLMGLCRAGVYMVAALCVIAPSVHDALVVPWWIVASAAILAMHTVGLSLVARHEASAKAHARERTPWLPWTLVLIGLLPLVVFAVAGLPDTNWPIATVVAVTLVAWFAIAAGHLRAAQPRVREAVLVWIAGMSLIDALVLALLGHVFPALIAVMCVAITRKWHGLVKGT